MTPPRRILLLAASLLVLAGNIAAAKGNTTFDPEFTFYLGYTDNLGFGGNEASVQDDYFARIDVQLPVEHQWKTGKLSVQYTPRILRYDEFDQLDRIDHFLNYRFTDNPSRKGQLDIILDATFTQFQGSAEGEDPSDAFLSQRTERDYYRGDIIYRQGFATTWRWSALASSRLYRFDPIDGVDGGLTPNQVEDRDSWMLAFQVDKDVSRRTFLGARYERSNFALELSGDADTDALLFTFERKIDRQSSFEFTVGGFVTRGTAVVNCDEFTDDLGCLAGAVTGEASDRSSGVQGEATYQRRFRAVQLRVRGGHRPSAGGALLGAIRFSWVQLSLSQAKSNPTWRWSIVPRWALRDPLDDRQADRQTITLGANVTRRITDRLSLRLRTNYVDQASDADSIAESDVWTTFLGLAWAPWRGTRMAER